MSNKKSGDITLFEITEEGFYWRDDIAMPGFYCEEISSDDFGKKIYGVGLNGRWSLHSDPIKGELQAFDKWFMHHGIYSSKESFQGTLDDVFEEKRKDKKRNYDISERI